MKTAKGEVNNLPCARTEQGEGRKLKTDLNQDQVLASTSHECAGKDGGEHAHEQM